MKKTKLALFQSAIALLLCFSMLIGTSFAWFTDSVTTGTNIIQSGNLDVKMYWTDDLTTGVWYDAEDASAGVPFDYDLWEPGYTEVRYVKIVNAGNLALKYQLTLAPAGVVGKLAEVIDVYYAEDVTENIVGRSLTGMNSLGVLKDTINGGKTADGALQPGNETVVALALKMDEQAGNDYQNETVGDGFVLKLLATQQTAESDSFGDNYDEQAKFPSFEGDYSASAAVELNTDNTLKYAVTLTSENGEISATVPAGTLMDPGVETITLTVSSMKESGSNIEAGDDQIMNSVDVHISGISAENQTAIPVTVEELMVPGLNIGNYQLYHVEDGETKEMNLTDTPAQHNDFSYDPATGDVTVAMATFSEIAMLSDTENAWNGTVAEKFNGGDGTETAPYIIANADQLAYMSQIVSTNETYASAHYKLIADVNLGGESQVFYPIGYWAKQEGTNSAGEVYYGYGNAFSGTFDGNGNTVSNIYQNTWAMDGSYDDGYWNHAMGLFGAVFNATIKNLTMDNFQSDGEFTPTGCIAAYAGGESTFENITLTNCNPRVYNTGNGGIVGLNYNSTSGTADRLTFRNITIDQTNKISALWGSYDVACGGIMGRLRENSKHDGTNTDGQKNTVTFENCHVAAIMDVNNDCCANYQYYQYRYSGMMIGTVDYIGDVPAVGLEDVVTAESCTVTYGDWNEYWYCELVANSLASYTHDHQFSRLTKISAVTDIQDEEGNWNRAGNFVIPASDNSSAECYHIFKNADGSLYQHKHEDSGEETKDVDGDSNGYNAETGKYLLEDRQCYFIPFGQLFTGYGWGSSPVYQYDGITVAESGTVKSEIKFESNGVTEVPENGIVNIGDLFKAVTGANISTTTVQVFVSPVGEGSTVSATYASNTDWTKGTLTFTGTGNAKVVITDYFYCLDTVLNIIVGEEVTAIDKFEVKSSTAVAGSTVTLGDLFRAKDGVVIDSASVKVDAPGCTYTANTEDWMQGTITFGEARTTVTISATGSTETINTVSVTENDSFTTVFENADTYLYRVGNLSAITLSSLFKQLDTATINGDVTVTVVNKLNNSTVLTATFEKNDWLGGTIDFVDDFTGVVAVTVDALGANPYTLHLEVVDAVNATAATDATENNVVLLNDIGSGFTVSGRYTVFGNGFTLNYTGNGQYLNNGLKQGVVMVQNGGTLDNLHIKATIYPAAYMYYGASQLGDYVQGGPSTVESGKTRYHYQLSAVATYGEATISNCYIYGGRNNIYVNTGNVTIKDSILECGVVANVQIQSTSEYTVTLENVTTIQHQVNATIVDTSKVMLGAGVLVGPDTETNPTIVLNGNFKQYNWVTSDDADAVSSDTTKMIINGALEANDYNHTVNGKTASNLGIIYMNNYEAEVTNNTGLPYELGSVSMSVSSFSVDGKVYSLKSATESQIYSDYANADRTTVNGDYMPTFDFDLGDQEIAYDGSEDTRYLYGDVNGVTALYQDGDAAITLDLTKVAYVYKYAGTSYSVTAICKEANGDVLESNNGVVTLSAQGDYTLEFTVNDNLFYNAKGEAIEKSVTRTFTVPLALTVKEANIKNAEVIITKTALDGVYTTVNLNDYKLRIDFLDCISVTDYDKSGTGLTVDLTANISSASLTPASVNVFTTASTITITYTDGRVLTVNISKISGSSAGTKTATVNTSGGVYFITDGALDNKPTAETNQNMCTITSVSYKGNSGSTVTNDTDVTVTWALNSSSGDCVTGDTLITLADGIQKRMDQMTYSDSLLVWDFFKGEYAVVPAVLIVNHGYGDQTIIELTFEDGTIVKAIGAHSFFDADTNKWELITADNAHKYIGHEFVQANANSYTTTKLMDVAIYQEYTESYSLVSAYHYNFITENMFSLTNSVHNMLAGLVVGEDMTYDLDSDVKKYGKFTYADFEDYITYEQYVAFNGDYLKISVEKGYITFDAILALIEEYL